MIAISQILLRIFKEKKPVVTLVQTSLEVIHEENAFQGCEFLDEFIRLDEDDISDDEAK
jgi:hypothetical protein